MQLALRSSLLVVVVLGCACDRPSESECKESFENVRRIVTQQPNVTAAQSDIEHCRDNSDKEEVACNRAAKTIEDLSACQMARAQRLSK